MPVEFQFLRPLWFLALMPLVPLVIGLWRARGKDNSWRAVVDAHLLPHLLVGDDGRPRRLPFTLLALGWLIAVVALAGPVWERLPQPVFVTADKRVILLDLSPSMNAADVTPSRLARARFEVLDLLAATREGQVALIAFSRDPYVVSPLTGDAQTIAAQVPRLSSELIPVPGPRRTERALTLAGELLAQAGAAGGDVILITDGVTDGSGVGTQVNAAARALAAAGHRLSVLGVGTAQGAPVPDLRGGYADAGGGAIPMSRLDPGALETLAQAGKGRYVDLDAGDRDTQALIGKAASAATAANLGQVVQQPGLVADQWREEGPWLLLALLPIAALAFRRGWLLPVVALILVLPPGPSWAFGWEDLWHTPDQQAAQRLAAGEGAAAAARFQDPAWRAAAHYRSGDYAGALSDLAGLSGAEADYNRGNSLARLGRFDDSIAAYERAIEQAPDHADARANLDLVKRLREQQSQQQSSEKDGQSKQDGTDGKDQKAGKDGKDDQDKTADRQDAQGQDQQSVKGQGDGESKDSRGRAGKAPEAKGEDSSGSAKTGEQSGGADPDAKDAQGQSAARTGETKAPQAGDLRPDALKGEQDATLSKESEPRPDEDGQQASVSAAANQPGKEPSGTGKKITPPAGVADLTPQEREQQQAMEAQLRRVPDDPAGLLRQRFILQQLRREGRLP